jgi:hypothetical protein
MKDAPLEQKVKSLEAMLARVADEFSRRPTTGDIALLKREIDRLKARLKKIEG